MPNTVSNQKWIRVHKSPLIYNFLSVPNNEWMTANKILSPYGLQLYLYLASNMDGYQFGLSPEHAEQAAGIRRTTFYEYLRKLETCGYLVWRGGNMYDFYTSPRPENERTHPDHHASEILVFEGNTSSESTASNDFTQQKESPQHENAYPQTEPFCSRTDIEINNKYADRQQEIAETNIGGVSACAEPPASKARMNNPVIYDGFVF
ncbi:MAG: hypothetical protein IJ418_17615 [Clostridia bacterium]|nr:hypothetical protein [Clostridia bacterium]